MEYEAISIVNFTLHAGLTAKEFVDDSSMTLVALYIFNIPKDTLRIAQKIALYLWDTSDKLELFINNIDEFLIRTINTSVSEILNTSINNKKNNE